MTATTTSMQVERMLGPDLPALRTFLHSQAGATVFHSPEWLSVIRNAYGHRCDYWVARSGTTITGAFPVIVVRAPLIGAKMVAMAYQMDSGLPLATSGEASNALVRRAAEEARRSNVRYLEVRSLVPAPELIAAGFSEVASGLVTTVVDLEGMELGRVRRNHRRGLRGAEAIGVAIVGSDSVGDLRRFHDLYLREGRAIGAPQAGRRFFECLHHHAPHAYRLYLARRQGRVIGGLVVVGDDRTVYARHAAYSLEEARSAHVGTALYWQAIRDSTEAGARWFNCGISWEHDAGLIHWKEGWSGTTRPVHTYVLPVRTQAPSAGQYLGGYRLAKSVWRRLPLPVAHLGGQLVTRWVC